MKYLLFILLLIPTYIFADNTFGMKFLTASSQNFTAADSVSLSITKDITIETWVNYNSAPSSGNQYTFPSKWNGTTNQQSYLFDYRNNSGTLQLIYENSSTGADGSNTATANVNVDLGTGVWHHVAVAVTAAAGTCEFYVDGRQIGACTGLFTATFDSTSKVCNCREPDSGATGRMDGTLDEARIWNYHKNAAEIKRDYTCVLSGNEGNLAAYWPVNNSLNDFSRNGNTLTNVNSATFVGPAPIGQVCNSQMNFPDFI